MTSTTPQPPPVTLADLVEVVRGHSTLHGDGSVSVHDVTHDSRSAGPGVLYAARPGQRTDGHDHAPAAVEAGSPALVVERVLDLGVPQLQVANVAESMGPIAAAVHGRPADELTMVGITGTNGKTTTTYLLEAAFSGAGMVTGVIGTVQTLIAGASVAGVRTTPESTDLQRLLRRMLDAGVQAAAMEVSSHGLALGRITGTSFDVAGFTNLSQDHLDFHAGLEDYFAAKARLFTPELAERAVVTVDDSWGRRLAETATIPVRTLSVRGGADITVSDVVAGPDGSTFTAHLRSGPVAARTLLPGHFNVANALLALALAEAAGVDVQAAAQGVADLTGVPGRMEKVDVGQPFAVLVDYAHTPDSVENVLRAARRLTEGRVVVVVGCGGDRDVAKRPLMGRAAAELADAAVFTSDNPRSEDPQAILDAMVAGTADMQDARVSVVVDRRTAIAEALAAAEPGDVVVIAGKGHETYQEYADRTIDFDDRAVARELLAGQGAGA